MAIASLSIAVVMIVRDEAGRVGRALTSVRGSVDSWLVIDTGSTDSTVEEIGSVTGGWPGTLLERPWVSFGDNRTELLQLARQLAIADWLLTIDADHVVEHAHLISRVVESAESSKVDALLIPFTSIPLVWTPRLIRADKPWYYVGATREYLDCYEPFTGRKIDAPRILDYADGASREVKWRRDVDILRTELSIAPDNARSWFCLGESYRGLDQFELASIAYTNCSIKTKFDEERYVALTMSGEMLLAMGKTEEGLARLLMANERRPQRREALLIACQVLNQLGRHHEVMALLAKGSIARSIPRHDATAILPDAYGSAMVTEFNVAKNSQNGGQCTTR